MSLDISSDGNTLLMVAQHDNSVIPYTLYKLMCGDIFQEHISSLLGNSSPPGNIAIVYYVHILTSVIIFMPQLSYI